jgi:hypothetical protein
MRLTTLFLPAVLLACTSQIYGQQISPNPNPATNTITVDTDGAGNLESFISNGIIDITSDGTLTNWGPPPANLPLIGTLTNHGTLDNYGRLNNRGELTNTGEICNQYVLTNTGTLDNYGMLNNRAELTNYSGGTLNNSGTLTNYSGCTLTNDDTLYNYSGGTLNNEGTLTTSGMLNNRAELTNYSGGTLYNAGTVTNHGTLNNDGGGTLYNQGTLTNSGMLNNIGILNNDIGGTLDNDGMLKNNINVTLDNYGTLNNNAGGTLANSGTLNNHSTLINYSGSWLYNGFGGQLWNSGEFTNNGTIDTTTGVFVNAGTLNGSGHIKGRWIDHGKFKPGNSAGVMTIDGDYFKVEGSKEIELGGLLDGDGDKSLTEFDWIDVTGNVELAGLLNVSLIDGFELHRGNTFEFLRVGGTLTGQYDGLGEGDLVGNFGGEDLFITYTAGDGNDVALYTIPEPTTLLLALLALVAAPLRVRHG